jgi:hypothetical protein
MEDIKVDEGIEITVERQEELGFLDIKISADLNELRSSDFSPFDYDCYHGHQQSMPSIDTTDYGCYLGHQQSMPSMDTDRLWLLPWTPTTDAIVEMYTNVEIYIATEIGFDSVI